jgi:hypothetical protein
VKAPDNSTVWAQGGSALGVGKPVTLTWNNGEGLDSAASSRLMTSTCSRSKTRSLTRARQPGALYPFG